MATTELIILVVLYIIPGFVLGIFAWDMPITGPLDYIKRVVFHTTVCILWLPFILWCIFFDDEIIKNL